MIFKLNFTQGEIIELQFNARFHGFLPDSYAYFQVLFHNNTDSDIWQPYLMIPLFVDVQVALIVNYQIFKIGTKYYTRRQIEPLFCSTKVIRKI